MHPFAALRRELRITQRQLARVAGITDQVVMRTEQGLYATPSVKLLRALTDLASDRGLDFTSDELIKAHTDWIAVGRAINAPVVRGAVADYLDGLYLKDFYLYFSDSVIGFCKLLFVQLGPVQRWNFKNNMPPLVSNALFEMGVTDHEIARINATLRGR